MLLYLHPIAKSSHSEKQVQFSSEDHAFNDCIFGAFKQEAEDTEHGSEQLTLLSNLKVTCSFNSYTTMVAIYIISNMD